MQLSKLNKLWKALGNVPVDVNECIETSWHIFEEGTDRMTIWSWFEDQNEDFSVYHALYRGK